MKKKHIPQLLVGIVISIVAFYIVLRDVKLSYVIEAFQSVDYIWLIPCLGMFYFGVWLRALRWRWLFQPNHDVPLSHATGGIFICFALNSILPARAGEFARAYLVGKRDKTGFSVAFGTVVAERLLDVIVLLGCMIGALSVVKIDPNYFPIEMPGFGENLKMTVEKFHDIQVGVVCLAVLLVVGIVAVSIPRSRGWLLAILHAMETVPKPARDKIEEMVHKFAEGLSSFHSPKRVVLLLAISVVVWVTNAASVMYLAWGFDFQNDMTFAQAFAMIVMICIFIMVPATPGYWGPYELGVVFSIILMGIHPDNEEGKSLAFAYAILLHLTQWLPIVAIGLPWAWFSHVSLDQPAPGDD